MDRFQEFSYFLQSLGATKYSIIHKRGKEVEQMDSLTSKTSANVEVGKGGVSIGSASGNRELTENSNLNSVSSKHISRTQVFSPTK